MLDLKPKPSLDLPEEKDFLRILGLSKLHLGDATPLVREIFATIGENLGIRLERVEKLLEDYLDEEARVAGNSLAPGEKLRVQPRVAEGILAPTDSTSPRFQMVVGKITPSQSPAGFNSPIGGQMVLIPGGEFVMGSESTDAGPDEQPLTPVTLSEFYMSRHPVTNAQYEQFDPGHRQKRMEGAGDEHPVVYVTSLEAIAYCQWLSEKDGENYRLPSEAEWEFAARGIDCRKYPWGNHGEREGFANFADARTIFPWRDPEVDDGYPETSPVGAFPRGASFFGLEDMAGNVWEWCLDIYQPLAGAPKRNPRGVADGSKRVYRGGSWKSRFSNLRTTARGSNASNYSCNDVGFRVACECGNSVAEDG